MLTKAQIEQEKPPAEGRTELWDNDPAGSGLPGFGVRVSPSGQRNFILRYRLRGSRQKQIMTIGAYGLITLPQARASAQKALATVKLGGDPQAERHARAKAEALAAQVMTVAELTRRYEAALKAGTASSKRLQGRPATPAYVADTVLHLGRFADACGKKAADDITRRDVMAALDAYTGQPSVQRRMHIALNRMYLWGRQKDLVSNRPTEDIETTTAPARERVLTLEEVGAIWRAADTLNPLYRDVVQLMILTGQRRTEVAGMRWGEIQLGAALWVLPAKAAGRSKSKREHSVPLAPHALAILQVRHAAFRHEPAATDLVLPTIGRDGKTPTTVSGWSWIKERLDQEFGRSGMAAARLPPLDRVPLR